MIVDFTSLHAVMAAVDVSLAFGCGCHVLCKNSMPNDCMFALQDSCRDQLYRHAHAALLSCTCLCYISLCCADALTVKHGGDIP